MHSYLAYPESMQL